MIAVTAKPLPVRFESGWDILALAMIPKMKAIGKIPNNDNTKDAIAMPLVVFCTG